MLKDKVIKRLFLIALTIILLGTVVFLSLISINWYWVYGWIYGSATIVFGYLINITIINAFFKSVTNKRKGIFLAFLRAFIQLFYQATCLILLIIVNTLWKNGEVFKLKTIDDLINPINLFTYLGSLSIFAISSIIVVLKPFNIKESEVNNGQK